MQLRRLAFFARLRSMTRIDSFRPVQQNLSSKLAAGILVVFLAAVFISHAADAQEAREWESPRLTGISNQPPHATMIICPDAATARRIEFTANSERERSSFYRSLNGAWKYHYSSNQLARVPDFWNTNFDDRA